MTQLEATIEAILFAVGDAVSVNRLTAAADAEPAAVAHALHALEAVSNWCAWRTKYSFAPARHLHQPFGA